ncbi:hypothetical protein E4P24_02040 [Haloferax sp. AS1]|uniref:hypothetical protein n=1 Tax=Haloferax sp. AS1 TaxID=2562277 RepID=UPI00165F58FF|nr:hypothetical protein [Haloferax sp. AS1]MBC9985153.1 hypothetical protein [Haloferax sp. AS1]
MSGPLGLEWVDNSEEWDPSDPAVLATVREHGGDTFADRIHLLADGRIRQQVMMDGDPFASTYFDIDIDSSLASTSESDDGETSVGGGSSPGGSSSPSTDTDDSTESTSGVGWLLDGDGSRTNFIALAAAAVVAGVGILAGWS